MAFAPQESGGPGVPLSKVPSVRQLCEQLGIQHASLKDSTVFMDAIHALRKSSTTSDGAPVTSLLDWNSASVQKKLMSVAVKFLEENDNGHRFWSPTRSWAQLSDLHYPNDKHIITNLLVQLIWKQNRYLRNNSYYNKLESISRDGSADQSTLARESHEHISPSTVSSQTQKRKTDTKNPKPATKPSKIIALRTAAAPAAARRRIAAAEEATAQRIVADPFSPHTADVFDVPDDSDDEAAPNRSSTSVQTGKHSRNEEPDCENEARKRKRHQMEESPRRTERKRNLRTLSYAAAEEEVNMILEEAEAEDWVGPPAPRPGRPPIQQADPIPDLQTPANISASEGPPRTTSDQNKLSNCPFTASTAPMTSTKLPSVQKAHMSKRPPPPKKLVSLKMPTKSTSGVQSAPFHVEEQEALSGTRPSVNLEASSTERQSTSIPAPVEDTRNAASFSATTYNATDSKTISNATSNVLSVTMQHVSQAPSAVSQARHQSSTLVPRVKIQITFFIITREPIYTEEQWDNGKIQGLSLADFLEGVTSVTHRSHIDKLKLTLRTPFSNTILIVHADAEDAWTTAKATVAEKLKESRAEARAKKIDDGTGYKIMIEPFYEEVVVTGSGTEVDDDAFEY